jgi:hypothetical protein
LPLITIAENRFEANRYQIDLKEIARVLPNLQSGHEIEIYVLEVRNEQNKLIRRFKPFEKLQAQAGSLWHENEKQYFPCIPLSEDAASKLNIGKGYKLAIIVSAYNKRPLLPFEIRPVGYDAEKLLDNLSDVEISLLKLSLEDTDLSEALSYLWDATLRLQENDVEGARTSVRNSLESLRRNFIPKIILSEMSTESSEYPKNLDKLIGSVMSFLQYGGPHPGPAPRTTTEMCIFLTTNVIKYLALSIRNRVFLLKDVG